MPKIFGRISGLSLIARSLILIGLLMIAYYYATNIYTAGVQESLLRQWRHSTAAKKTSGDSPGNRKDTANYGDNIFGRLRIPRLKLDVIVLEGTDWLTLTKGPGHLKVTPPPWTDGNTVISGHRTTYGTPFARLNRLATGDKIYLSTLRGELTYKVTGRATVRPTDLSVIGQSFKNRLTLTTCDPPGSAIRRLAVWAQKI